MPDDSDNYRQFVKQFSLTEWKMLCRHRLFLHFLRKDLKVAASIAADALGRHVVYQFPANPRPASKFAKKTGITSVKAFDWRNHPRFRI
jgi:hypothetical protein